MKPWALAACFMVRMISHAQVPVPFVTDQDRFMVFANGRFEKMEPRPPKEFFAMEDQLVYRDHDGALKIFIPDGRRLHLLQREVRGNVRATRARIAWNDSDTLKTVRDGRVIVLRDRVERFGLSDSLIVLSDSSLHELGVLWKGGYFPLASTSGSTEAALWTQGTNTVACFSKEERRLFAFYRGKVFVLCDSTDVGIVAAGTDVIAYWDDKTDRFMVFYQGSTVFLSDLRPASVQAGDGCLAFVDGNGRLKCFMNGSVHSVMDGIPSGYWMQDSLLLYLDNGQFKLFKPEGSITVEHYVPERWGVEGSKLVYLDLDRALRGIEGDERKRYGTGSNIPNFDVFGTNVIYRSPLGNTVVVTPRRISTY